VGGIEGGGEEPLRDGEERGGVAEERRGYSRVS